MGKRQDHLKHLTLKRFSEFKHDKISFQELHGSIHFDTVKEVYNNLRGQLNDLPIGYGTWDISTTNFIIELDEERHFNRYRRITLESTFYNRYKLFSPTNYKRYCTDFEKDCLSAARWGKYWKNDSSEKMFIKSDQDLDKNGSSRWRQRAYYDFLKDVTAKIRRLPIIRVSIYDTFRNRTIGDLLTKKEDEVLNEFIEHITK